MLAFENEAARRMFAVYVRPEDELLGEISFYPNEAAAEADVGPGMPAGVLTHGTTYIEYIGDALLFAPDDWPLIGVNPNLLVQLEAEDFEIFVALSQDESDALLLLASEPEDGAVDLGAAADDVVDEVDLCDGDDDLVDAPDGISGTTACAIWQSNGLLTLFPSGPDGGGRVIRANLPRPDFGDEIASDEAVVCLLGHGWVPLIDDTHTWRELGPHWIIRIQQRVSDADEQFFGRYTPDDGALVVTRAGADTDYADEHLQLIADGASDGFGKLVSYLTEAGWAVDVDSEAAAEMSVHPELSESPGWYPVEADEGIEWVCAVSRASTAPR